MQRQFFNRVFGFALGCSAVVAIACSDSGPVSPVAQDSNQNGSAGSGSDTSQSTPPTSNGPVATVRVSPAQATIPVGYSLAFDLIALDANGARVSTKPASWRSDDVSVVVVSDTGVVSAKAVGTTTVSATIDGHSASATVTVVPAPQPPPTPTPQPALASFDLNASIVGAASGTDTTKIQPVAGAVVKLLRVGGVNGDSLSQSIDAGSAVSDANGAVSFKGLVGGSYTVSITPPADSPFAPSSTGFGPPRSSPAQFQFRLLRKSP